MISVGTMLNGEGEALGSCTTTFSRSKQMCVQSALDSLGGDDVVPMVDGRKEETCNTPVEILGSESESPASSA